VRFYYVGQTRHHQNKVLEIATDWHRTQHQNKVLEIATDWHRTHHQNKVLEICVIRANNKVLEIAIDVIRANNKVLEPGIKGNAAHARVASSVDVAAVKKWV
jgi:hypothetical protein